MYISITDKCTLNTAGMNKLKKLMLLSSRQAMHVNLSLRRSCTHYCNVKAISITYSDYVFVALGFQYVMHVRHTVICGLYGCTNVSTIIS